MGWVMLSGRASSGPSALSPAAHLRSSLDLLHTCYADPIEVKRKSPPPSRRKAPALESPSGRAASDRHRVQQALNAGRWDEAIALSRKAEQAARDAGENPALSLLDRGTAHYWKGQYADAHHCLLLAADLCGTDETAGPRARCLIASGRVRLDRREFDEARRAFCAAIAAAAPGMHRESVLGLLCLGDLELECDDLDAAETRSDEALAAADRGDPLPDLTAAIHLQRSEIARRRGRGEEALDAAALALAAARRAGLANDEARALVACSLAGLVADSPASGSDPAASIAALDEGLELLRRLGSRFELARSLLRAGDALLRDAGPAPLYERGMRMVEEALECIAALDEREAPARAALRLARRLLERSLTERAQPILARLRAAVSRPGGSVSSSLQMGLVAAELTLSRAAGRKAATAQAGSGRGLAGDPRLLRALAPLAGQMVQADRAMLAAWSPAGAAGAVQVLAQTGRWQRREPELLAQALAFRAPSPGEAPPGGLSVSPLSDPRLAEACRQADAGVESAVWIHLPRPSDPPVLLYFDRTGGGPPRPFSQRELDLLTGLGSLLTLTFEPEKEAPRLAGAAERVGVVARDKRMRRLLRQMERVCATARAILLQGEPGTGKGLFARWIHELRAEPGGSFIALHWEEAAEAMPGPGPDTVLVEEMDKADAAAQGALLRALKTREAAGSGCFVFTADTALRERVEQGAFRDDFYQRIAPHSFSLPALRERRDDIGPLALHFLRELTGEGGLPRRRLAPEAMDLLVKHDWPGNVRSLLREMERAVLVTEPGSVIGVNAFSDDLRAGGSPAAAGDPGLPVGALAPAIEEMERQMIRRALAHYQGNKSKTARTLGLTRRGLDLKMKRLGI